MSSTKKLFLQLIRDFINGTVSNITTEYDTDKLYALARSQAVTGIIGYQLIKCGAEDKYSSDERLSLAFDRTVTQFVRRDVYASRLIAMLNEANIPHILFKGLVIKECYPIPELRTYGDVDIIIKPEDRQRAHQLMLNAGFTYELMDNGDVYGYQKGREYYELHTTLNSEKTKLSNYMRDFWSYTKLRRDNTFEFEHNFHFCYLISHIEKHVYGSGAGVRMYMDIALFIKKHSADLDFDKIRAILKECGLDVFLENVLYLCKRWFGTEIEPLSEPDDEVFLKFCEITLRGGTFGMQDKESTVAVEIRNSLSVNGKSNKFKVMLSHIFPPYKEVRRMYPAFNGKPYLLPAAWCMHFFKAAKRSGLKNIKRIAATDVNAVKPEKELLEHIGSRR